MPKQMSRQGFRVRRHVEALVRGHAGIRARGDVPDRVAAGLAGCEASVSQAAHGGLDVVQLHEMELHVLPRGDVPEAARVAFRHVRECLQLLARQHALRDLDAQHLRIVRLPLTVGPAHEPELPPLVGRELPALVAFERLHELVDFGVVRKREPRTAERFRIIDN